MTETIKWLLPLVGVSLLYQKVSTLTTESTIIDCSAPRNANIRECIRRFQSRQIRGPENTEVMEYINALVERVMERDMYEPWVRKEIRNLTPDEWRLFAEAIMELKYEAIGNTNRYDAIGSIHSGAAVYSGHNGPNFLGWHRILLLILEAAINLPIPYWDSRLDFHMEDPTHSILWTDRFFGNGDGVVTTGPFANWTTPSGPLVRNYGMNGSLIRSDEIRFVLSGKYHSHITSNTSVYPYNLEHVHNNPHVWVGGQLSRVNTAPQDPIFFLHHAFIDYVWELFRQRQSMYGINSTEDYPSLPAYHLHYGNRSMEGWTFSPGPTNKDGYSDRFAKVTRYHDPPETCGHCFNYAWPIYVFQCRYEPHFHYSSCVSAEGQFPTKTNSEKTAALRSKTSALNGLNGPEFVAWYTDPRTRT